MRRFSWLCLVFCVSVGPAVWAQDAELSGLVRDSSAAAIANATLKIVSQETGTSRTTKTNHSGLYSFPALKPGLYDVDVSAEGFKKLTRSDLKLEVAQRALVDFTLEVGSVQETVTVTAGTEMLNATDASVSTVVDRQFVENIPLNGRSFNTLLQLTPGVIIAPTGNFSTGQFSINGQRTSANYFRVDGVSANFGVNGDILHGTPGDGSAQAFDAYGGTSSLVSIDAMQEFRVQTSSFAPEYGRTPGGQVSITTRSGTNQFHGGIFDYFRNDKLDANDWFANAVSLPRAPERQNDFGAFLGGRLLRDRTFFFFSYEGLRLRQPQTSVNVVPSLALRASALPAIAPFLNAYPKPNGATSGNTAQFTSSFSNSTTLNAASIRMDHVFNSRMSIFGRYNEAPSQLERRPGGINEIDTTTIGTRTLTVGTTWQLTPRVINSFRGNYSLQKNDSPSRVDSFGGAVTPDPQLFLGTLPIQRNRGAFAATGIGKYLFGNNGNVRETQLNFLDDVAFSLGAHQLKFGADYRTLFLTPTSIANDLFYFVTSLPTFASTGNAFVFAQTTKSGTMLIKSLSLYGQDAWKIGARLTLSYGFRWELNPAPSARDHSVLAAWTNVGDPSKTALAPPGTPLWRARYDNFAPRVGVAYSVTQKGDLVIRGGWGLFYDQGTGTVAQLGNLFPNTANQFVARTLPLSNPSTLIPTPSLTAPYMSSFIRGFSPDLELPYSQQWNVAIEKALRGQQAISITYVGQLGRRLLRPADYKKPNANFLGDFVATLNEDTSDYHALQAQYRKALSRGLQILANYTWSHSIDTNSDDTNQSLIPNVTVPVVVDRGSSSFDVRHNFSAAISYDLPRLASRGLVAAMINDWSVDMVASARSGFPINMNTGGLTPIRPDLVTGVPVWIADSLAPGGKRLNPAAFATPTHPGQGTLGRNSIYGFGLTQIDLSVGRRFNMGERVNLQFRIDSFNVLNHPNFTNPDGLVGSDPTHLRSTQMVNRGLGGLTALYQVGGPRSAQLSLKLTF